MTVGAHTSEEQAKSPEQVEQEIQTTRTEIDKTINKLQEKLSPGQLLDEAMGYLKDDGREIFSNLGASIRENPAPLALIGVGAAWLAFSSRSGGGGRYGPPPSTYRSTSSSEHGDHTGRSASIASDGYRYRDPNVGSQDVDKSGSGLSDKAQSARATAGQAASNIGQKASDAKERVGDSAAAVSRRVSDTRDDVVDRLSSAEEAGKEQLSTARDHARGYAQQAQAQGRRATRSVLDFIHDNPLVVGAVALAAGAVIAASLPPSKREDELLGDRSDALKGKAKDIVSDEVEKTAEATRQAGERAKQSSADDSVREEGNRLAQSGAKALDAAARAIRSDDDEKSRDAKTGANPVDTTKASAVTAGASTDKPAGSSTKAPTSAGASKSATANSTSQGKTTPL